MGFIWINDDDDNGDATKPDYSTGVVNGQNDLKDFFPLALMIQGLVSALPPGQYSYVVKQADGALNFTYTNLTATNAYSYLTSQESTGFGTGLSQPAASATVTQITTAGVTLDSAFLKQIGSGGGLILVDGRAPTVNPLVLSVQKDGVEVASLSLALKIKSRVIVLLHGMNSDTTAWNDFVDSEFNGSAATISGGIILETQRPQLNRYGARCYKVLFGAFDGLTVTSGLEGITADDPGYSRCGDFESFAELGQEVSIAIGAIRGIQADADILLVGHSRGGISARAFLQNTASDPNKDSVIGLLTTGSPHQGSRMGRIYEWLYQHPRLPDGADLNNSRDWSTVDWLISDQVLVWTKPGLDVRRPVINDLADNSTAIAGLNAAVTNLPALQPDGLTPILYGEIVYHEVLMGNLSLSPQYSVLGDPLSPFPQLSNPAAGYVLATAGSDDAANISAEYANRGDGLIPAPNQLFTTLPGFTGIRINPLVRVDGTVVHTGEPNQISDLAGQIRLITGWGP